MLPKLIRKPSCLLAFVISITAISCGNEKNTVATAARTELDLKRGALVACGPAGQQLGTVDFTISCGEKVQDDFNLALKLLHSFEYDESEKVFARIIDRQPDCAMAYWGVAMSNFHPLWTP